MRTFDLSTPQYLTLVNLTTLANSETTEVIQKVGGVYINSNLTTLVPGGYIWKRTGTIISPITSGDSLSINTINEETLDNGIDIETVHLENGNISNLGTLNVDTITEKTLNNGVSIEGVLLKDNNVDLLTGGLKDSNVITAIKLGDASNTTLNTTNKTIVGSTNEINYELLNELGNGVKSGFTITINADNTKIDIASGKGIIVNNSNPLVPVLTNISYAGGTAIVLTNIATANVTYLAINASGTVIQQTSPFTMIQRRSHILIGAAIHSNRVIVNAINNLPDVALSTLCQYNDLLDGLKGFNVSGNIFTYNGANLNINKSDGYIFKKGANFINSALNPHNINLVALVAPTNIRYRLQNGTEYTNTAVIDPGFYDNAGTRTALAPNKFTIQRINLFTSNLVRIQYGQAIYNNMSEAIQGIQTEVFNVEQNIAENGLLRGLLIVRSTATDLSISTDAKFLEVDRFGGIQNVASGGGTTTLQQAYNNSIQPQITTNATLGSVQIKRGSAADTDVILEGLNGAGASKFSVTGEGIIKSDSFTASTILSSDASKNIVSLPLATYPSLTELSYVKGVTSSLQPQITGKIPFHGFVDRSLSSVSVSGLTVTLTKGSNYTVYVNGTLVSITENKTVNIADTTGLHYISMDNTGALSASTSPWSIKSFTAIPVAIVWIIAGTSSRIWDERHGYNRNLEWHYWAHTTIGSRYVSGLTGTFATASISVTSGQINDEDIENTTGGTVTTVTHVYRATGGVNELYDATPSTTVIKTNGTNPVYDNNGTLSPISLNNYANFFVYGTNDATNKAISTANTQLYCVVGQGDYSTVAAAQAAPNPTFNSGFTTAEIKLLYRVIIRRTTGAPAGTYIQADDLRAVSTGPAISGSTGTVTAGTVTFSPAGNIAATNVQAAIEELDTEKAAISSPTITAPTFNTSITTDYLTTGSVLFAGATKNITQDNTNLFWDNTNKRLGVGTATPGYTLEVNGDTQINATTGASYGFKTVGTAGGARQILLAGQTGVSNGFTVDYTGTAMEYKFLTGNVGIGTTSPSAILHTKSTGELLRLETTTARGGGSNYLQFTDSTGVKGYLGYASSNDNMYLTNILNGNLYIGTNSKNILALLTDGNVGIGTTNPRGILEVVITSTEVSPLGTILSGGLNILRADSATGLNIGYISTTGDFYIQNQRNDTNVAYNINLQPKGGNIGIGATTPNHLLTLSSATLSTTVIGLYNTYSEATNRNWAIKTNAYNFGDLGFFVSSTEGGNPESGSVPFLINKAGAVGMGTNSPAYKLHLYNASEEVGILTEWGTTKIYLSHGGWSMGAGKFGIGLGAAVIPSIMIDTATSNVGIGTTTPTTNTKLAVNGLAMFGAIAGLTDATQTVGIQASTNVPALFVGGHSTAGESKGIRILAGKNSSDYSLDASNYDGTSLLYVRGDGNVGIGTNNPVDRLDVYNGGLRVGGATVAGFMSYDTGVTFGAAGDYDLKIFTNTTEKMRVTSIGDIGIGTTDLDGTPATGRLTIKGSTNDGSTNIFVGRDSDEVNVATLDTNGLLTISAIKITTGAGAGKVLTSDADGDATWGTASVGGAFVSYTVTAVTTGITTLTDTTGTNVVTLNSSGGAITLNLPAATSNAMLYLKVINATNTITVNRAGTDNIFFTSNLTSFTMSIGQCVQLASNLSNLWMVI